MKRRILFFLLIFNLTSCCRNYLYVQQDLIDIGYLASSHVGTPDPIREDPPYGQRLLVSWNFPQKIFSEKLQIFVSVRFWDLSEEFFVRNVERRRDCVTFFFPLRHDRDPKRILTYYVRALNLQGEIVGEWEHPFWVELIRIGESD